ncbi:MAG: hypothetical protein LBQ75_01825 [Zoogloeaceae bacterium]|jgi:hypothetical protein|nr:hypothetical protein [Zoogloeaceae bacterium]
MRLEWTLRGADLTRANQIRDRIAEDWETLCHDKRFVQKGNLLTVVQSPWDDTDPFLSLEDDSLIFDGDRMAFQIHCLSVVLDIFDAQVRQECPSPEIFDTLMPNLEWWQVESDADDLPENIFPPEASRSLAAA